MRGDLLKHYRFYNLYKIQISGYIEDQMMWLWPMDGLVDILRRRREGEREETDFLIEFLLNAEFML